MEAEVILVDTNAWVHHLRRKDARLVQLLMQQRVRTCDIIVGELLLGAGLPKGFTRDLLALPFIPSPAPAETRVFIQRHAKAFAASGIGWADAQIVHAATKAGARLYTSDRSVRKVCASVGLVLA